MFCPAFHAHYGLIPPPCAGRARRKAALVPGGGGGPRKTEIRCRPKVVPIWETRCPTVGICVLPNDFS
jgi:hypothetical protein